MTKEISTHESISPSDKFEFTTDELVDSISPIDPDDESFMHVTNAFGRLLHAGLPLTSIISNIEAEVFHSTFELKHAAELIRTRQDYFGTRVDAEKRYFLHFAANLSAARLENRIEMVRRDLIGISDEDLHQLEEEYFATIAFQNSIYQPKNAILDSPISVNGLDNMSEPIL